MKYDIVVRPLPDEKGGGYMGYVPDLQGCASDGETPEEAFANTIDAMNEWLELHERLGRHIPAPGTAIKRAKEDRDALMKAINVLSSDLNNRLDDVEAKVVELQKVLRQIEDMTNSPTPLLGGAMPTSVKHVALCH